MPKSKLPVIKVFYYGDEPRICLPRGLKVNLKFIDQEERDLLIVRHKGVSVYQAVKDFDIISDCWAAPWPGTNWESTGAFDLRELPASSEDFNEDMARKKWSEEQLNCAFAIEEGWLTEEGLKLPKEAPSEAAA